MAEPRDPYDFGPPISRRGSGPPDYGAGSFGTPQAWEQTRPAPIDDEFGRTDHGPGLADPYVVVRTPVVWLLGAMVLGIAGAVGAALLGTSISVALAAWFLAGPLAIGLIAVHSWRDTALRTRLGYDQLQGATAMYAATIVVAAVGIGLSAWRIAEWAGRL
jgi:hypothetical protein